MSITNKAKMIHKNLTFSGSELIAELKEENKVDGVTVEELTNFAMEYVKEKFDCSTREGENVLNKLQESLFYMEDMRHKVKDSTWKALKNNLEKFKENHSSVSDEAVFCCNLGECSIKEFLKTIYSLSSEEFTASHHVSRKILEASKWAGLLKEKSVKAAG